MTEQGKMPERVWLRPCGGGTRFPGHQSYVTVTGDSIAHEGRTVYIRADLVEQMAEALRNAIKVANEAREEWDKAPSGMKAGKLLIALSDPDMKYRADITAIHAALSTYAAAVRSKEATP